MRLSFYFFYLSFYSQEEFDQLSGRRKRARTEDLRGSTSAGELSFAAQMKLRQEGQREAATIVKKAIEASPRTLHVFLDFMKSKTTSAQSEGLRPYLLEEALAYQYQCKMTKAQYIYNRQSLSAHNAKVFPSYERLTSYRRVSQFSF